MTIKYYIYIRSENLPQIGPPLHFNIYGGTLSCTKPALHRGAIRMAIAMSATRFKCIPLHASNGLYVST